MKILKFLIFVIYAQIIVCDGFNARGPNLQKFPAIQEIPFVGGAAKAVSRVTMSIPGASLVKNTVTNISNFITQIALKIPGVSLFRNTISTELETLSVLANLRNWKVNHDNNACTSYWAYPIAFIAPICYTDMNIIKNDLLSLATERGYYSYSVQSITTKDGYVIQINTFQNSAVKKTKDITLVFVPGLAFGADIFMDADNKSIAKQMVYEGYNVITVAMRGTKEFMEKSMRQKYNTSQPQFWNYTLDTLASMDFHTITDVIGSDKYKEGKKLIYVTHSTAIIPLLMYIAENPKEAQKIDGIVALAPVTVPNNSPLMVTLAYLYPGLQKIFKSMGMNQLFYNSTKLHQRVTTFCKYNPYICVGFKAAVYGPMSAFAPEYLLLFSTQVPDGVSLKALDHFFQIVRAGRLQKYDYGEERNKIIYHQIAPPLYDLGKIKNKILILYGENDVISTKSDVKKLISMMNQSPKTEAYPWPQDGKLEHNHISFLFSKNAPFASNKPFSNLIYDYFRDGK